MRAFIVSYGRADIISTHKTLPDYIDWTVLLHNDEERAAYEAEGMPAERIVVTNVPTGKVGAASQKQYIEDHLTQPDEWYVAMDDNVLSFTAYEEYDTATAASVDTDHNKWKQELTPDELGKRFDHLIRVADGIGAHLIGFATTDNPFFRKKHYSHAGFIIGKAMLKKSHAARLSCDIQMEDFELTAENLLKYGIVLRDNWIKPKAQHYQKGGIGSMATRLPQRQKDAVLLLERYPNLFRVVEKKNQPLDMRIRVTENTVNRWRYEATTILRRRQRIIETKG